MKLAVLYPHPGSWPATYIVGSAIVLVAISAAVIFFGREQRWLLVGWLWFLGMLVPAIGLVQVGVQSMADRYTYLPLIGLFVMVAWVVEGWVLRKNDERNPQGQEPGVRTKSVRGQLSVVSGKKRVQRTKDQGQMTSSA